MPILCFSEIDRVYNREDIEIESIKGLILVPTGDVNGQFRRGGICEINEDHAAEFFYSLSNQEEPGLLYEDVSHELLRLDEIVPERWSGKGLNFLPQELIYYETDIL
jgi:hypothetical protein